MLVVLLLSDSMDVELHQEPQEVAVQDTAVQDMWSCAASKREQQRACAVLSAWDVVLVERASAEVSAAQRHMGPRSGIRKEVSRMLKADTRSPMP